MTSGTVSSNFNYSHQERKREPRDITLTSHTPVFCLAPVRSSSPRSAMVCAGQGVRPQLRLRELGRRGERGDPSTAQAAGRRRR